MKDRCFFVILLFLLAGMQPAMAQLGYNLTIKKPAPYENRELKSEKSGNKKFTVPRRIMQNTFTHYNYFFNANNKINEIVARAKESFKDDYSQLLPFYNYQLSATAQDKDQLDSVIYKTKTGVVLHDLRNDWIDDLYMLWGQAYYLQQEFDSAYQMFQFINYAFADKEKDGYYKYIGSRMDNGAANRISSNEHQSLGQRLIADKPSRNNALLWQVRSLIGDSLFVDAGSLLAALRNDPTFPERLRPDLEEVQAWWYYKQERWDSAAFHLRNALDNATNQQERARWEFLDAQLFQKSMHDSLAIQMYTKVIGHTTDPVMELYARLNLIGLNKSGGENYIDQNIAALMKMAHRDKYVDYRDAIYYMAGEMELARSNYPKAQEYFLKAGKYKGEDPSTASKGFLQLADLYFARKEYKLAAQYYDSVQITNMPEETSQRLVARKDILGNLMPQLEIIERQDSLQRIAAMPEKERNEYIRKLGRQLRRQHGLAEETAPNNNPAMANAPAKQEQTDLFSNSSKGDWYFYNNEARTQGAAAFQRIWGKRPNVDNWRRYSDVVAQLQSSSPDNTRGNPETLEPADQATAFSNEGLLANLPLTEEKMQRSNDSIAHALFTIGRIYTDKIEDYESAINTYDSLRRRFPDFANMDEVLFQLYYCYTKVGNTAKAAEMKALLAQKFPGSHFSNIANTGKDAALDSTASKNATKAYEGIYDLYLAGKFDEAKAAKQAADSLFGGGAWQPQLLYLEAVYDIKQGNDSAAKTVLNELIQKSGEEPIGQKASTLLNVLNRRKEIEQELRDLQIEQPVEEEKKPVQPQPVNVIAAKTTQMAVDTVATKKSNPVATAPMPKRDTFAIKPTSLPPANRPKVFTYQPAEPHYAVVVLKNVDVVFGNEAKNAFNRYNQEKYYNRTFDLNVVPLNDTVKLLTIGPFANIQEVVNYVQQAKPSAASEIVPWLKSDKYSFSLISDNNLQLLQEKKNLAAYLKFLDQNLPVKL